MTTRTINYHWNQAKRYANFGIVDHTSLDRSGQVAYQAAKYFRYAGRVLVVVGVSIDVVSIALASKPMRRATEVVAGWASAWVGCKTVGAGGAAWGNLSSPIGSAVVGVGGCIIGGAAAYYGGATLAGHVYDWAEDTIFVTIPETLRP